MPCPYIIKHGFRRGQECGKKCKNAYCWNHKKYINIVIEPKKKDGNRDRSQVVRGRDGNRDRNKKI